MSNYAISLKRTSLLLAALAFTAALLVANLSIFGAQADAAQLSSRKLTLTSSLSGTITTGAANSETNGSDTTHTFDFTVPSTTNVEAVMLKYCTTAIGVCTAPTNMSAQSSTLTSETFAGTFANDTTSLETEDAECAGTNGRNNCVGLTNATGADESGARQIVVGDIRNPDYDTSAPYENTFFVRIQFYGVDDYTSAGDDGTVANAITQGISITSRVVETLGFSTTAVIDTTNVPAETSACVPVFGSGAITIGDSQGALSIAQAYDGFSAFRLFTNSANGVLVQYAGDTLTKSVTDDITAIGGTATASTVGSEQFGLAIDTAAQGGAGNYANFDTTWPNNTAGRLELDSNYDGGNGTITNGGTATFAYDDGTPATPKTIASSDTGFGGYVTCDTALVRYIANIAPTTAAGTYTTTVVYFAVPTY